MARRPLWGELLGSGRALSAPPLRWLGPTSFSLYLIHIPVLGTVFHLGYGKASNDVLCLIAQILPLGLAEGFYRLWRRHR